MLSTAWTTPARVAGGDGFAMPARAAVPTVQGSGVPASGAAVRQRLVAGDAERISQLQQQCTTPITQNDGTTLGSHPSRRPLS